MAFNTSRSWLPLPSIVLLIFNFLIYLSYYSTKKPLLYYLKEGIGSTELNNRYYIVLFNYLMPIFHIIGVLSDDYLGKYFTLLAFTLSLLVGQLLFSIFSIDGVIGTFGSFSLYSFLIPTAIVFVSKGSLHPLLPSIVSDQIDINDANLNDILFSLLFLGDGLGTLLPSLYYKELTHTKCFGYHCYFSIFFLATLVSFVAVVALVVFKSRYVEVPHPHQFSLVKMVKFYFIALFNYVKHGVVGEKSEREGRHWIDFYNNNEVHRDLGFILELKKIGRVVTIILPLSLYYCINAQTELNWKLQSHYLVDKVLDYDTYELIFSILKLIFSLMLGFVIYPKLRQYNFNTNLLYRIGFGYTLILLSSLVSIIVDYSIVNKGSMVTTLDSADLKMCTNCLSASVQLPQYILYSVGESILVPSSLQFITTQCGLELKTHAVAVYVVLTPLLGNLVADALQRYMDPEILNPNKGWVFFTVGAFGFLLYIIVAKFRFNEFAEVGKENEVGYSGGEESRVGIVGEMELK